MFKVIFLLIGLIFNHSEGIVNPCKKGLTGNQFFAHPESDSKYIHCTQWGQMFEFSCAEGLVWDSIKLACERRGLFDFFQNIGRNQAASNLQQTTRKPIRINPSTLPTSTDSNLPVEPASRLFTFPTPVIITTTRNVPVEQVNRIFTFPPQTLTSSQQPQPVTQRPQSTQQTNLFTFPSSIETNPQNFETTSRVFTTITNAPVTTTTTTFSTTTRQADFVQQTTSSIQTFSSGDCSRFSVANSMIPSVNGVYTKLNSDIFRRSDNLRIPGLIVHIGPSKWCLTLTFFSTDLNSISPSQVNSQCGSNLECCILISNSPDNLDLTSPSREWTINILDSKGEKDEGIVFDCKNIQKICPRVPFCPPECLKNVDGCDVCECDGKPFFNLNSGFQVQQNVPQQPAQTTTLATPVATTRNSQFFSITAPTFQQFPVQNAQRLLASKNQVNIKQNLTEPMIVRTCDMVRCPGNSICAEATNCLTCNPMCFPDRKFELPRALRLTCNDIACPQNNLCLLDNRDKLFKCIQIKPVEPSQLDLDIQAMVVLNDFPEFESFVKTIPTTTKSSTTTFKPMMRIFPALINQSVNSTFLVNKCSMVKCPEGLMCAEATKCETCNPLCFPKNQIDLTKAVKLTCENVSCPVSMKCLSESTGLKCVQ